MRPFVLFALLSLLAVRSVCTEKLIVFERPDGFITIITPSPSARRTGESEGAFVDRVRRQDVDADAVRWKAVDRSQLPTDRYFRDAWQFDIDTGAIDRAKSQQIQRDKINRAIDKRLVELRDSFIDADMRGDQAGKAAAQAESQTLRDAKSNFDLSPAAAPTLQDLRNRWPAGLAR